MGKSSNKEGDGFGREDSYNRQDRRWVRECLKNASAEEEVDDEIYREPKFAPKDKKPKVKPQNKHIDNGKRDFLNEEEV